MSGSGFNLFLPSNGGKLSNDGQLSNKIALESRKAPAAERTLRYLEVLNFQ